VCLRCALDLTPCRRAAAQLCLFATDLMQTHMVGPQRAIVVVSILCVTLVYPLQ
jgi:hypothetical protein